MTPTSLDVASINASAKVRGRRLKCLRRITDLSRKAFEHKYKISAGTLQGWEDGRYGGLSIRGAHMALRALAEEGIECNLEWLFYGQGDSPKLHQFLFCDEELKSVLITNSKILSDKA